MADIGEKNYLMSEAAKETTAQEILGAVGNVAQQEDIQEILSKMGQGMTANVVKSVQRGAIGFNKGASSTTTINEVDVSKTVVLFGGCTGDSEYFSGATAHVTLENSTTVKVTREGNYSNTYNWVEVAYTVLEFY